MVPRILVCVSLAGCALLSACGSSDQPGSRAASSAAGKLCEKATRGAPGEMVQVEASTAGQVQEEYRARFGRDEPVLGRESADAPVTLCTLRFESATGSPSVSTMVMAVTGSGNSTWVDGHLAGPG